MSLSTGKREEASEKARKKREEEVKRHARREAAAFLTVGEEATREEARLAKDQRMKEQEDQYDQQQARRVVRQKTWCKACGDEVSETSFYQFRTRQTDHWPNNWICCGKVDCHDTLKAGIKAESEDRGEIARNRGGRRGRGKDEEERPKKATRRN